MLPNFVVLRQELCEISAVENLCYRKRRPKFTKKQEMTSYVQISLRSVKRCTRKALQFFYIIQYFGASGGPPVPKFTNLGDAV